MRIFLSLLCCICAGGLAAATLPADLVEKPLGEEGRVDASFSRAKFDGRTRFEQLGIKPTLAIFIETRIASYHEVGEDRANKLNHACVVAALRECETIAGKLDKQSVAVAAVFGGVAQMPSDAAIRDAAVKRCLIVDLPYVFRAELPGMPETIFGASDTDEHARIIGDKFGRYGMRWMWIPEPGLIEDTGKDFNEKTLAKVIEPRVTALAPLIKTKAAMQAIDALAVLDFKAAGKALTELRKAGADSELLARVISRVETLERKLFVEPLSRKRYWVEVEEHLNNIATISNDERRKVAAAEIAAVKEKPEYARSVAAHGDYVAARDLYIPYSKLSTDYFYAGTAEGVKAKYLEAHKPIRKACEKFLATYRETAYAIEVQGWLEFMESKERALGITIVVR